MKTAYQQVIYRFLVTTGLIFFAAPFVFAQEIMVEVVQRSDPGGIFSQSSTTMETAQEFLTQTAPMSGSGYSFTHWEINGVRYADGFGRSLNPVSFTVTAAVDAVAFYIPTTNDVDSDGVPDWYEMQLYNSLSQSVDSDTDTDGYTLLEEYNLDLQPLISNSCVAGNVSLRMGGSELVLLDSNLVSYTELSRPGGIITARDWLLSNGVDVVSQQAPLLSSGYAFEYWTVNGVRQVGGNGMPLNPVSLTLTTTVEAAAYYVPADQDTSGEGIPDWWQMMYYGSVTNGASSDTDGDGFDMAYEYAHDMSPIFSNDFLTGGVSLRVGGSSMVIGPEYAQWSIQSEPAGLFSSQSGLDMTGTVKTATANLSASSYRFVCWTLDGVTQRYENGETMMSVEFVIGEVVEAVAQYIAATQDGNGEGVPDWWQYYYYGNLKNAASDTDHDGYDMAYEYAHDMSPIISNSFLAGGVSLRMAGSTIADVQVLLGGYVEPDEAWQTGACWRVDGGNWLTNMEYHLLAAGSHYVEFRDAEGWEGPGPQTVQIYDRTLAVTGTYEQVGMGELEVKISPADAVTAGAQWRFAGPTWQTEGPTQAWYNSENVVDLTARQLRPYNVICKDLSGWVTPLAQDAWLTNGSRTSVTMEYSAGGRLDVMAMPLCAARLGGWRVDEGEWNVFSESNMLVIGEYELEFKPVNGWLAPSNRTITISQGATTSVADDYVYDGAEPCEAYPLRWKWSATSSGDYSTYYPAEYAIDGSMDTRWRSPVADDQWLQVDLGRSATLCGMKIYWDLGYAANYTVELSQDGASWTNVYEQATGSGENEMVCWPPEQARYLRINLQERAYDHWGFAIWDMDVISPCGEEIPVDSVVTWYPVTPKDDETVTVSYTPNDGPLAAVHATDVFVRYAGNVTSPLNGTDVVLVLGSNGVWSGTIAPQPGDTNMVLALHDGNGVWDNRNGTNWWMDVLPGSNDVVRPGPGNLSGYRGYTGMKYLFAVTGTVSGGSVWGTDVYRDVSDLAVSCVHAGVLTNGEYGMVEATILGGQEGYTGMLQNAVTSLDYGAWTGSYSVARYVGAVLEVRSSGGQVVQPQGDPSTAKGTDFDRVMSGSASTNTFLAVNAGVTQLVVSGWQSTGTDGSLFSVEGLPLTIEPGQTSMFEVVYAPVTAGVHSASIELGNNSFSSNWVMKIAGRSPQVLSISGLSVADKVYDGTVGAVINDYGSLQGVDPSNEVSMVTTGVVAAFEDANAGSNKVVQVTGWELAGADADDYLLGDQVATASISRASQSITFAEIADQYISNTVTLAATASSGLAVSYEVSGPASLDGVELSFSAIGAVEVTASQAGNGNWLAADDVMRSFAVTNAGGVTPEDGSWSAAYVCLTNTPEAELMCRIGDIDNLGYGWPEDFDPFSGESTPQHDWPFTPSTNDADGTDRIMVLSSYDYASGRETDGYVFTTTRPDNDVQTLVMNYSPGGITVSNAMLQLFVDDFQAPEWDADYTVTINGVAVDVMSDTINALNQTGPIGKLISMTVPQSLLPEVASGSLQIRIDDNVTGAGDGYAIDFVKLLVNVFSLKSTGTMKGRVTDVDSSHPVTNALVRIGGLDIAVDDQGDYVVTNVAAGRVVVFCNATNYLQQVTTVDLVAEMTNEVNFELVATGYLQVQLTPETVVTQGAQWRIDSEDWQNSAAQITCARGTHSLSYITLDGWVVPTNESVAVSQGGTSVVTAVYRRAALECGLPADAEINDDFEDWPRGEGAAFIVPWEVQTYAEVTAPVVVSQGIGGPAYSGTNAMYLYCTNDDPGWWAGVSFDYVYPEVWALPDDSQYTNIVLSFDVNAGWGSVYVQFFDENGNDLVYQMGTYGGWQHIDIRMDQFYHPNPETEFDSQHITRMRIEYPCGWSGDVSLMLDNVLFSCGDYVPPESTHSPSIPDECDAVTIRYAVNDGWMQDATNMRVRMWMNDTSGDNIERDMTKDSNGVWNVVYTPVRGVTNIIYCFLDDQWRGDNNGGQNWTIPFTPVYEPCGLPMVAVVNESFETYARGEGAEALVPWSAGVYSETGSMLLTGQGIGDTAFTGTNGLYVTADNPDPGSYCGMVLDKAYPTVWALPAEVDRSNSVFQVALMETNGMPGWAEMQLKDAHGSYISYRAWYYGDGWQLCKISLDQIQKPGWVAEFDEDAVTGIHVEYGPAAPGTRTVVFDDISVDCGTYMQSAVTYDPHTVRETEPVRITYTPNDHYFRYASQIQARFWQNDQSDWVTTQSPMTQDVAGVWYGIYVPTGGVTTASFCFFDEYGNCDNHEQWNWNITVTPYRHQVQIDSTWGDVQPTNGTFEVIHNTIVTSTVPGLVENGYTQYLATGWAMTGMQGLSSSETSCVMMVTGDVTLVWGWSTSYWLNVSAGDNGSVLTTSDWFSAASTATVNAVADEYYTFSGWSGDVPAESVSNMPLNLLMDQSRFVSASFNELVTGNTGTPYWWLAQYGWTNNFDAAAADDQDGDDVPSWSEYVAGTDPADGTSLFYAPMFEQLANGDLKIIWTSVSGHVYQVEYCDLAVDANVWWPLAGYTNVPATVPTNSLVFPEDQKAQALRIYRIQTGKRIIE